MSENQNLLVSASNKKVADELKNKPWKEDFETCARHSGKAQESRLWTFEPFRQGCLRLLVATDVLDYGISMPSLTHVVVHDPASNEDYVHRIGRTARGNFGKGHALVFFEHYNEELWIAHDSSTCRRPRHSACRRNSGSSQDRRPLTAGSMDGRLPAEQSADGEASALKPAA